MSKNNPVSPQPSSFDFFAAFPTEDAARKHLADARWPNGITCHHCGHNAVWTIRGGRLYTCKACRKQFTVRTGTVMEDSALPLQKWLYAMYLMTVSRKGVSSIQLAKELGVTQKTAWFVGHRIREACKSDGLLSGKVEADHAYFGGKEGNKHLNKRHKGAQGGADKTVVFGAVSRDGGHRAMVVSGSGAFPTYHALKNTVEKGALLITDSDQSFNSMNEYSHEVVNHSHKQYVRGDIHTNSIESFWAVMKRAYMGTFHHWSPKHVARYANEFTFKANTKDLPAFDKSGIGSGIAAVREFMAGAEGKRLTYEALTCNP